MNNFCSILDNCLDKDFVEELNASILHDRPDSFFIKKDEVNPNVNIWHKAVHKVWFEKLKDLNQNIFGYEVWYNTLSESTNLGLHVDCDEEYFKQTNEKLRHPSFTSVLYTGPQNSISGGQLAINLEKCIEYIEDLTDFTSINPDDILKDNENWLKIEYKYNRLVLCGSGHPHLVLPMQRVSDLKPRTGLTIAAWSHQINIL